MICRKQEEKCQNIFEFDSWLCAQYLFSYLKKKLYKTILNISSSSEILFLESD